MALLPPPPGFFPSRADLLEFLRSWGADNGYVTVISHSAPARNYASIRCDRSGTYRNTHNLSDDIPHRERGRVKTDCPFRLKAHAKEGQWTFHVQNPSHNHPPFSSDMAPARLRTLTSEQVNRVASLTYAGATAHAIVVHLRHGDSGENPSRCSVRDVVNTRQQLRLQLLAGRTPVQALLREMSEEGWVRSYETDMEGHLCQLFFASPVSLTLFDRYPEVLILDCTYNTNRFRFPLLNMVGINGLGGTFYVAFAFIRSESEDNFKWALEQLRGHLTTAPQLIGTDRDLALMNAIQQVFPSCAHTLCRWHVNKGVKSWVKKHLAAAGRAGSRRARPGEFKKFAEDWKHLISAATTTDFMLRWRRFRRSYRSHSQLVSYLEKTWIRWKERFVDAWVDNHLHLGAVVTSRVEGAHATLKRRPDVSLYMILSETTSGLTLATGYPYGPLLYCLPEH